MSHGGKSVVEKNGNKGSFVVNVGYVRMTHHSFAQESEQGNMLTIHLLGLKMKEAGPRAQKFLRGYVPLTGHAI